MQNTTKKALCFFMALSVIFAASTVYYGFKTQEYEMYMEHFNQRAFSQLIESMSNLDGSLQKMRFAASNATISTLSAQIWRQAAAAKSALSALPLNSGQLQSTEKFIGQTGDYAYSILRASAHGGEITKEQHNAINSLSKTANQLSEELAVFKNGLDAGQLVYSLNTDNSVYNDFENVEQDFPEYATLIYDGPFSEHIGKIKPALTVDLPEISQETAMKNAAWFLGIEKTALSSTQTGGDIIKYFRFGTDDGKSIDITKNGGIVLAANAPRSVKSASISPENAIEYSKKFLTQKGFENMKQTYYTVYENIMTINFAYFQNEIMVYPDLIKLNVALDNCEIIGFDARGYIMNHKNRLLPRPKIAASQAQSKLSSALTVESANIAIIPTSGQNETLCHEFICKTRDELHVIVYINALTGFEEHILILLESENGTLTI